MTSDTFLPFAARGSAAETETSTEFQPKFDKDGLIPAVVTDAVTGNVLMFAWMNATALDRTLTSGLAHFWSRSRAKLWCKGEESGNTLTVREVRTDCDQDVLWVRADLNGDKVACHTGTVSCFYRTLVPDTTTSKVVLERTDLPAPPASEN